jgi:murein DD-endopeptidase MepM/ murein hydrolase activator NlpD
MLTFIQTTNDIKNNGSIGRSNRGDRANVIRATFSPDEMIGEEELLKKIDDISKGFRVAYEEMMRRERIADYLPTLKPVENGYITSGFGYRVHPILEDTRFHTGVDISALPKTPVRATAIGKVIEVSQSKNYGKYVKIKHINGIETLYAHLSNIFVRKGEFVEKGEIIGTVGETGLATGPHLHYEILYKGRPVDPLMLMIE